MAFLEVVEDVRLDVRRDRRVGVGELEDRLGDVASDLRKAQVVGHRLLVHVADDLARLPGRLDAEHAREPVVERAVGAGRVVQLRDRGVADGDGKVGRRDLDRDRLPALDQGGPVHIDDLAARRGHQHVASAVLLGVSDILVARQDLEEPQAEEDDREHRQREAAEDRHPHGELGRQRRTAILWEGGLNHLLTDRTAPPRPSEGRFSGLRPPVV